MPSQAPITFLCTDMNDISVVRDVSVGSDLVSVKLKTIFCESERSHPGRRTPESTRTVRRKPCCNRPRKVT